MQSPQTESSVFNFEIEVIKKTVFLPCQVLKSLFSRYHNISLRRAMFCVLPRNHLVLPELKTEHHRPVSPSLSAYEVVWNIASETLKIHSHSSGGNQQQL